MKDHSKMKKGMIAVKRVVSLVTTLCLGVLLIAPASASEGFSAFHRSDGPVTYSDVSGWYVPYVDTVSSIGLMRGSSNENGEWVFRPNGIISLAETVTLASRIRSIYSGDEAAFEGGGVWYQPYVEYALKNRILSAGEYSNYNQPATRAQFAQIMARALPGEAYAQINTVEIGAIPDVDMGEKYALNVYKLYRSGIITGGSGGAFSPSSYITRGEVAAVTGRVIDPSCRVKGDLYAPLYLGFTPDEEISGTAEITKLVMINDGGTAVLTIDLTVPQNCTLSLTCAGDTLIENVAVEMGASHAICRFPLEKLERLRKQSADLVLELRVGGPVPVADRFYISVGQFEKYFSVSDN